MRYSDEFCLNAHNDRIMIYTSFTALQRRDCMRHKPNGNGGHVRNGQAKGFVSTQEQLRRFQGISKHPLVKAALIQAVNTTPLQAWQSVFPGITYPQARYLVASITAEESLTALALLPHQLGGKDVLRGIADRNAIAAVAEETRVSPDALARLATTVQAIRNVPALGAEIYIQPAAGV